MHACALADELGIPRVVIPRYPASRPRWDCSPPTSATTCAAAGCSRPPPSPPRTSTRSSRGSRRRRPTCWRRRRRSRAARVLPRARHALPRPGVQPDGAVRAAAGHGGDDRRRRGRVRGGAPPPLRLHADRHRDRHRDPAPARAGTDPRHRLDGRRGRPAGRRRRHSPRLPRRLARVDGRRPRCARTGRYDRRRDDHRAGGHDRGDPARLERTRRRGGTLVLQREAD